MSAAVVGACGARISGAMYSGVPIAPVTWEEATVSQMRATPKSASFGVQVRAAPKDVHEAPTLNSKSDEILEENMPVTVEPGIYIPDEFGVRIEDLAIITDFGIINTVKSPKELMIL